MSQWNGEDLKKKESRHKGWTEEVWLPRQKRVEDHVTQRGPVEVQRRLRLYSRFLHYCNVKVWGAGGSSSSCLLTQNTQTRRHRHWKRSSLLIRVHPVPGNCYQTSSLLRASSSWTSTTSGNTTLSCWRSNSLPTPRSFHFPMHVVSPQRSCC